MTAPAPPPEAADLPDDDYDTCTFDTWWDDQPLEYKVVVDANWDVGHEAWHAGLTAAQPELRAQAASAERERIRPLLTALHRLYLTVWEDTATVDIEMPGYNGLSYDDANLIDAAGEAVEKLLATGAFADLLEAGDA